MNYTNYAFVKGRLGLEFLEDILNAQIYGVDESQYEATIQAYVEEEIGKIESLIDAACIRQTTVPVPSTNKSYGILVNIAEALIIRKILSYTQQDDLPAKVENEYIGAMRTLTQIMRGDLTIAQDGQTGPSDDGDSMAISTPEADPFHTNMEEAW